MISSDSTPTGTIATTGLSVGSAFISLIASIDTVQEVAAIIAIVSGSLACISWSIKIYHQVKGVDKRD